MDRPQGTNVIDFAAYRAAHPRSSQPQLPFAAARVRSMTPRGAAHRERMLRHLHELKAQRRETIAETATFSGN